jgi:hypothetical protein
VEITSVFGLQVWSLLNPSEPVSDPILMFGLHHRSISSVINMFCS